MADAAKVRRGARRNRNKKKTKEPATASPEGSFDEPGDGAAPPPPPSRTDAVLRIEELERENAAARKARRPAWRPELLDLFPRRHSTLDKHTLVSDLPPPLLAQPPPL